jgi:hypothetical protein
MKRQPKVVVINSVPLRNAVLCADCECISESRSEVCGVCGGRSLVNLGRLLGSAWQSEAERVLAPSPPSPEPPSPIEEATMAGRSFHGSPFRRKRTG